ncbi:hypothetical protein FH609_020245 [Streptomyces sp. 3MP-14]|uniref:Uncharacterized protein n=1 Tax=Streptomyces mimosae TaxID=2586635 RepID=A0A5N5ZZW9_9ACTN|nr:MULTISPECIES: hypothetical protein [Streptomyces]KAB8161815.1 hypothetical protein FH607_024175 [Streptomyces mimosae]KAB8174917.1 hypothetical protein FH609_020245 [Streptomyces sp. 3MP-14]
MSVHVPPWAANVLGKAAPLVQVGLGQALRNMQANAQAAHEQSDSQTKHTFGMSRWENQFQRVQDELKDLPDATAVRPYRFPFDLMLVGRGLIYPYKYAETTVDVRKARGPKESELIRELFSFAPPTRHVQDALDIDWDVSAPQPEPRGGLANLPEGTRLILVPFACNASELLAAFWGIAALGTERHLEWVTEPAPLTVPKTVTSHGTRLSTIPAQASVESQHTGFAEGSEPTLTLSSRGSSERLRGIPPLTEAEPVQDQTSEDDATH